MLGAAGIIGALGKSSLETTAVSEAVEKNKQMQAIANVRVDKANFEKEITGK